MKIKITNIVPVAPKLRPEIGTIHPVIHSEHMGRRCIHFIAVGQEEVGVFEGEECEVVADED